MFSDPGFSYTMAYANSIIDIPSTVVFSDITSLFSRTNEADTCEIMYDICLASSSSSEVTSGGEYC